MSHSAQDRVDHRDPAQLNDLISEERRLLELEVARGRFHLPLELLDHTHELVTWDLGNDAGFATAGIAHLLLGHGADAVCNVFDFLDDSARYDAVSLVVLDLQGSTPV